MQFWPANVFDYSFDFLKKSEPYLLQIAESARTIGDCLIVRKKRKRYAKIGNIRKTGKVIG